MGNLVDSSETELLNLARAIERDCQEGVKWERSKLEWILEEERKQAGVIRLKRWFQRVQRVSAKLFSMTLTVRFEFDEPGFQKATLTYTSNNDVIQLPLVGDYVLTDTAAKVSRKVIQRSYSMGLDAISITVRCE